MNLWIFFPIGYTFTVLVETPILLLLLSRRHPLSRRLFAGFWLTLCTYPIVVLVLPAAFGLATPDPSLGDLEFRRIAYLVVAETFAPVAECVLFYVAFHSEPGVTRGEMARDFAAIVLANLASFGLGELIYATDWFQNVAAPWLRSLGT